MPQDPNRAFEIPNGIIIDESVGIFSGEPDPNDIPNVNNYTGNSIYFRTNGLIYSREKNGSDWKLNFSVRSIDVSSDTNIATGVDIVNVVSTCNLTLPPTGSIPENWYVTVFTNNNKTSVVDSASGMINNFESVELDDYSSVTFRFIKGKWKLE